MAMAAAAALFHPPQHLCHVYVKNWFPFEEALTYAAADVFGLARRTATPSRARPSCMTR